MLRTSFLFLPDQRGVPLWRRAATLLVVLLLHALLMLLLLRLAPPPPTSRSSPSGPISVSLLPDKQATPEKKASKAAKRPRTAAKQATKSPVTAKPAPVAPPSSVWSQVVPLTSDDYAKSDIGKMRSQQQDQGQDTEVASATGAGSGGSSKGGGGIGEQLFDADWYRKPTHAELSAYMPSNGRRVGWGMIACRTIPDNRVDDCREIGQYPEGSGLAGAVRQAAWQFRVRPPRIGGRALIGAWVRIRIEYTERGDTSVN
ncbi:hypothetical protein ACFB49_32000 [Sphingomonas sp. DBB INV C78]|uniref:hypothetical protein n=1 Tax=Sphingomonas sp. DBB INV C78 TaxID=3349434 RepID=UPI0036D29D2B